MSKKKRKYNITKILLALGAVGIVVLLFFSIQYKSNSNVDRVSVVLNSRSSDKLVGKSDIVRYLNSALKKDIEIEKVENLDIKKIEKLLNNSRYIKYAQVFVDSKNNLSINCQLRDPIVRVSRKGKDDVYFDEDGELVPLSKRSVCRVPILSGNLVDIKYRDKNVEGTVFNSVLEISRKIYSDSFLRPLIEQMYIDEESKLILIPKLGRQEIVFGAWEQIDEKLEKIKAIYKSGMKGAAWREFKKIDLNWEGQVVITKTN